jgi:hypothetical protein
MFDCGGGCHVIVDFDDDSEISGEEMEIEKF